MKLYKPGDVVICMLPSSHYWIGEVVDDSPFEIGLVRSAWISDMGRHSVAMTTGVFDESAEIELNHPDQRWGVPRLGTLTANWPHDLPNKTK